MARARNIKPALFKNELLGQADPLLTLLFQNLWCLADKEGRLEDRPLRIKAETFPYREGLDVNGYLTELQQLGFIRRYKVGGIGLIEVINFKKHQTPHSTEKASELPGSEQADPEPADSQAKWNLTPLNNGELTQALPPDSLIPDSLIPDSGFTDSLLPQGCAGAAPPAAAAKSPALAKQKTEKILPAKESKEPAPTTRIWFHYAEAYERRYSVQPVRNAKVNGQLAQLIQRLGADEAPLVAAWFVAHNNRYYVQKMHAVDCLLADCEKLRTEWATNTRVTETQARQADKTQTNFEAFAGLIAEAEARERAHG